MIKRYLRFCYPLLASLFFLIFIACDSTSNSTKLPTPSMASSFKNNDTELKPYLETEHFLFYSPENEKEHIDQLKTIIEENYDEITGMFKTELQGKTKISIHPTIEDFHKTIGWPEAPDHVMAAGRSGIGIDMVYPEYLNSKGYSMEGVITHEFAHMVTGSIIGKDAPLWMTEGIAEYVLMKVYDKKERDSIKMRISQDISVNHLASLDELTTLEDLWAHGGYDYPYTIMCFTEEKYGLDQLNKFLRKPNGFKEIFNMTKEDFEKEWHNYLKQRYASSKY